MQANLTDRESLVFISAESFDDKNKQFSKEDVFEKVWFDQAKILFNEYHLIDHNTLKEEAQRLIQEASVIFLCGGYLQ